jgi:predicted chitinase
MLTETQLRRIMPNLSAAKCQLYLPHLNQALRAHEIGTSLHRCAAFVAQLAHESGEFRYMEELWGPTPAQRRYEPASDLAARLGNSAAGDGRRFKGRGPIQITGRFNYAKYGGLLGIDLVGNPELAATPEVAFATAGLFWRSNGLNALADAQKFEAITRRINGGINGLADRQKYHARALEVLSEGYLPDEPLPTPRGAPSAATDLAPLPRGHEAILEVLGEAQQLPGARKGTKKAVTKKAVTKKAVTKKAVARKVATKKVVATKAVVKQGAAKKLALTRSAARKAPSKKAAPKKATAAKAPAARRPSAAAKRAG